VLTTYYCHVFVLVLTLFIVTHTHTVLSVPLERQVGLRGW